MAEGISGNFTLHLKGIHLSLLRVSIFVKKSFIVLEPALKIKRVILNNNIGKIRMKTILLYHGLDLDMVISPCYQHILKF